MLELLDPSGAVAASASASNQFDAEAFVERPRRRGLDGARRARGRDGRVLPPAREARVDGRSAAASGGPLLPNLKAVPPYELGFVAPANPLNGAYPPDTVNPPLSVAGQEPLSCAPDELAPVAAGGGGARDCLRLTTGPINTGDGPFVKLFTFASDAASGRCNAPPCCAAPRSSRCSGATGRRRCATRARTRSTRRTRTSTTTASSPTSSSGSRATALVPAGVGTKSGFCPADQLIGEWRSFTQDPAGDFGEGDAPTGNCYVAHRRRRCR